MELKENKTGRRLEMRRERYGHAATAMIALAASAVAFFTRPVSGRIKFAPEFDANKYRRTVRRGYYGTPHGVARDIFNIGHFPGKRALRRRRHV